MTYRLLFPHEDEKWLKGLIKKSGHDGPKDPRLTSPPSTPIPWGQRAYTLPVRSYSDLVKRYPHWAVRLQMIFEEADDPTPTNTLSRLADRYRASRHSFAITALAFTITILFGLLTLGIGGAQIWIAYCTWHPTNSGVCRTNDVPTDSAA